MNPVALKFLKELLATATPSGYEEPGQKVVRAYMKRYADEVETDVHGSVHGILNPEAKTRIMLAGHCDEIGLMVMHVDDKGFIYIGSVGGINVPLLQGERVLIHTKKGKVNGVIGVKPIHLMTTKERESSAGKIEEVWLDIGAKSKAEVLKIVAIGDVATINSGWTELRNGLIAARGMDDRIGAYVIADVLRLLKGKKLKVAVHAVSTVQEEIGLRGAKTSAFGVDPQMGIAVDVGFATDAPNMNVKMVGEAVLGSGPILHRGPNFNHKMFALMEKAAKSAKVKTQLQAIPRGSGTDANALQMNRAGVAAALISIPNRYMHSPVEVVSLKDAEDCAKLIAQFILNLKGTEDITPG